MGNTERADLRVGDDGRRPGFSTWVRPARQLRRIDRILSQWTPGEIARMEDTEARAIARLLEIRAALVQ